MLLSVCTLFQSFLCFRGTNKRMGTLYDHFLSFPSQGPIAQVKCCPGYMPFPTFSTYVHTYKSDILGRLTGSLNFTWNHFLFGFLLFLLLFIFILLFSILKLHALKCFHGISFDCFLAFLHPIGEHLAVSAVYLGKHCCSEHPCRHISMCELCLGLSVSKSGFTALKGTCWLD